MCHLYPPSEGQPFCNEHTLWPIFLGALCFRTLPDYTIPPEFGIYLALQECTPLPHLTYLHCWCQPDSLMKVFEFSLRCFPLDSEGGITSLVSYSTSFSTFLPPLPAARELCRALPCGASSTLWQAESSPYLPLSPATPLPGLPLRLQRENPRSQSTTLQTGRTSFPGAENQAVTSSFG